MVRHGYKVTQNTGVVERAIQPAVQFHYRLDQRIDLGGLADVGLYESPFAAFFRDARNRFRSALGVNVGDNDFRAFSREQNRGGAADPRASAGDESDLTLQPILDDCPLVSRTIYRLSRHGTNEPKSAAIVPAKRLEPKSIEALRDLRFVIPGATAQHA
jgi:hypothetical protein